MEKRDVEMGEKKKETPGLFWSLERNVRTLEKKAKKFAYHGSGLYAGKMGELRPASGTGSG